MMFIKYSANTRLTAIHCVLDHISIFLEEGYLEPQQMTFAFCEICFKRRRKLVNEY